VWLALQGHGRPNFPQVDTKVVAGVMRRSIQDAGRMTSQKSLTALARDGGANLGIRKLVQRDRRWVDQMGMEWKCETIGLRCRMGNVTKACHSIPASGRPAGRFAESGTGETRKEQ
jgi:hypothetical protein